MVCVRPRFDVLIPLLLAAASAACGSSSSDDNNNNGGGGNTVKDAGPGNDATTTTGGNDASTPDTGTTNSNALAVSLDQCDYASIYAAPVTLGSQSFEMIVDTGSTTLGVASSTCTNCDVTPSYTPGSTATDEKQQAQSVYGSGSWTGEIYQDNVAFGSSPTVQMTFAAITSQTGFFGVPDAGANQQPQITCGNSNVLQTGIIGFDVGAVALKGTDAFFDQLVSQKGVANEFAVELCDQGGTLWLGGYGASATTAAPQYTPLLAGEIEQGLSQSDYYSVDLETIAVDGVTTPVAISSSQFNTSVVDTGTNSFLLGTTAFTALANAIESSPAFKQSMPDGGAGFFGTGNEDGQCIGGSKSDLDSTLPKLTLTFGTGSSAISVTALPTESYLSFVGTQQGESGWCASLEATAQSDQAFPFASIFGSPMIKSNVVVFDRQNSRVGFAPHAACAGASSEFAKGDQIKAKHRSPRFPAHR